MNLASAQQLWSKLASAGLTVGNMPEAQEAHTPWYVRVMLGIAGFIAAVFLLGFVGVGLAFVLESKIASLAAGFMMIAAAYAVFRATPHSDFGSMFALAVSFTGQALVVYGVWGMLNERSAQPWVAIAAIEAILALFMPNFIHRVVSAYAAVLALALALASSGAEGVAGGLVALAVAGLWLNEVRFARQHAVVTPIGYAPMVRPGPCPGWGRRSLQRRSCSPYGRSCGGRNGPCRNRKASFPSPLQRRSARHPSRRRVSPAG